MKKEYLTVVAQMKAKKGKEAELKEALLELLEPTRREQGCVQYEMHQSHEDPGFFIFYENWESQAHLDAHFKTPHLKKIFLKEPDLVECGVKIYKMKKCGL